MSVFDKLEKSTVQNAFHAMAQRAMFAAFVQLFLYPVVTLTSPELYGSSVTFGGIAALIAIAVMRGLQLKFGRFWMRQHGLWFWRLWFMTGAQGIAAVWGLTCAYAIVHWGLEPVSLNILIASLGTVAITGAAYPFDIVNNWMFQALVMLPIGAALTWHGNFGLGAASLLYLLYGLHMAYSLRKSEFDLLGKNELLARQHKQLNESHEFTKAMLSNINESFIVIDLDGRCTGSASSVSKSFFGLEPAGVDLPALLGFTGKEREKIEGWYRALAGDILDFDETARRGPATLELQRGALLLKLKYNPMRDEKGQLMSVILTAVDVTREVKAERAAEDERERAELILRIHENREAFKPFLNELDRVFNAVAVWKGGDLATLKRDLHTLKGTAMLFGAAAMARFIYAAELVIRDAPEASLDDVIAREGERLRHKLILWRTKETNLFTQLGVFEDDTAQISRRRLREIERELKNDPAGLKLYAWMAERILTNDFDDLLRDFEVHVRSIAVKLGKNVTYKVIKPDVSIPVANNAYREILRSMVHLFNNAVDHGIESPAERRRAGKEPTGEIRVSYTLAEIGAQTYIRVVIQDDGGGIDLEKLRTALKNKGRTGVDERSDLEIAATVFEDGLSTRPSVTELSGQGVGMGAVRAAVLKARGKVQVTATSPGGTTFEILLPYRAPPLKRVA